MSYFAAFAALAVFAGLWPFEIAQAQTASKAAPSLFAPIETPAFDPDLLKPKKPALDDRAVRLDAEKAGKSTPEFKLPNRIDLGKYDLEFKAGHTGDINPRTGFDSGETSNLSSLRPGQKSESALPDYFGLKLTAPTH